HLADSVAVLVADETGQHLRFAIVRHQHGARVARAYGREVRPGDEGRIADFEADADRDLVVQHHARLHVELEADVEIIGGLPDEAVVAGPYGGHRNRNLVADVDLGLLAVLDADARIGQQIAVAVLAQQADGQPGRHADARPVDAAKIL